MSEEIEINFRLDSDGRTCRSNSEVTANEANDSLLKQQQQQQQPPLIDYQNRVCASSFRTVDDNDSTSTSCNRIIISADDDNAFQSALDDLLFDCEISDSGLMPRTFWIQSRGTKARFSLEQMAMDVFHQHVPDGLQYDEATSGSEWWVQIRPSPEKAGRYSMHDNIASQDKDEQKEDMSKTGISFHWDKDEDLRILCGGDTYIHPHISTVTYLTTIGAPTLTANCRIHPLTGKWIVPSCGSLSSNDENDTLEAFVCWPNTGKHLSFDGRFLHAAPGNLMKQGDFEKQCSIKPSADKFADQTERKKMVRRHRRVTFLVNIWLNHRPFGIEPFPETMIDKMSGHTGKRVGLSFERKDGTNKMAPSSSVQVFTMPTSNGKPDGGTTSLSSKSDCRLQNFTWPMGDCGSNEKIKISLPLSLIQSESECGGNVQIGWPMGTEPGPVLYRGEIDSCDKEEHENKRPRLSSDS